MSRQESPLKFEADKPVHGLVAGTRLEKVLKHLAADPDADQNVKHLSRQVLHAGDTTALRPLYDALQDQGHRLAHSYNWPNAEWKLHLDAAVGHALDSLTRHQTELGMPEPEARSLALSYVRNANQGLRRDFLQTRGFVDPGVNTAATEAVGILHGIGHSKDDIQESLNRHQLRTKDSTKPQDADQKAVQEKPDRDVLEVAARYSKTDTKKSPVHPIVKGTRLALVLKELAKTGNDTTKALAKSVLRDGETHSLMALADHLQTAPEEGGDGDHELAKAGYDFHGAAHKLRLDQEVHPAATKQAEQFSDPNEDPWRKHITVAVHAGTLIRGLNKEPYLTDGKLAADLRDAVRTKFPDLSDDDLRGSLLRLHTRANDSAATTSPVEVAADLGPALNKRVTDRAKEERKRAALTQSKFGPHGPLPDRQTDADQFKFARTPNPKRGGFLAALKRVQSAQQGQLRDLAESIYEKGGLTPVTVRDAIHSAGELASAGTAQAIGHNSDPDLVRRVAAEYGLASQSPALLLFHVNDGGADSMHKFSVRGSGEGLLKRLDRAGLTQRTLVPTKTGWDAFIFDPGSKLSDRVRDFASQHGSAVQSATGQAEVIGTGSDSAADSDSRSSYRAILNSTPKQEPASAGVQPPNANS